jgi:SAM-dependent methyltransferase
MTRLPGPRPRAARRSRRQRLECGEYDKLDRAEDRMWWFAAMHANLLLAYRRMAAGNSAQLLLDAGCGTGGLLARIAAEYPEQPAIGIDADYLACRRAAAKSARPVCAGSVNALPFGDAVFAAIFSADVLCHRDVDERAALAQFHRCLTERGVLILNLPAYGWLMSRHDRAVCNVRRYTRRHIVQLLEAAGFRLVFTSYWNIVLFPVMVATRKLMPAGAGATSDVRAYPAPIEMLCRAATGLERAVLRAGLRFPFGGSLIAIAAKEATRRDGHA